MHARTQQGVWPVLTDRSWRIHAQVVQEMGQSWSDEELKAEAAKVNAPLVAAAGPIPPPIDASPMPWTSQGQLRQVPSGPSFPPGNRTSVLHASGCLRPFELGAAAVLTKANP